jgi:co-chaperonin GroES (HSP10)
MAHGITIAARLTMKNKKLSDFDHLISDQDDQIDQRDRSSKPIRRLHPLGLRVVAKIIKDNNISDGGLYLPEGAKEATQESVLAQVIEVASALDARTEEETNISGIPLGSMVLIPKNVGIKVPWDDNLRIIDTREVLAVVDEIKVT